VASETGYSARGTISADDDVEDSLLSYWKRLSARKGLLVSCALAGVLAGVLFALPQTRLYQSRVSLEIQVLNEDFLNRRAVEATAANYAADTYMQTQIKILQSSSLVERVIQKLRSEGLPKEPPDTGLLAYLQNTIRLPGYDAQMSPEKALAIAGDSVTVRGSGMTRVVEVFCESPRPRLTAQFANLLAEEFIRSGVEVRLELSQQTSNMLTRQVQEAKVRLENAEHLLQDKAHALGLEFTGNDDNLAEGKLQQLQMEILRAQADKVQKQSRYELTQSNELESLAEILDDPSVREYRTRLAELQRQSAELSATMTPVHPKMLRLQPQIDTLRADIDIQRRRILERIKKDYEAATRREDLLKREYSRQSRLVSEKALNGIEYNIARREVDTNRQVYAAMMQKVKEAEVAAVTQAGNARIIDRARPATAPNKPNVPLVAAVGGFGGSFIGILLVLSGERVRRRFVTREDLAFLFRMPELGVIPPATAPKTFRVPKLLEAGPLAQRTAERSALDSVELTNSFQFTLTSILFSGLKRTPRKLLVLTSPSYGEGKTFTAVNLAVASSRMRKRVLLVDADFRKPELHRTFALRNDKGFSDLLLNNESLTEETKEKFLQPTPIAGLTVLTSGSSSDGMNLMFSSRLLQLMSWFREHFDTVFIDAPAILHTSEARLLALHADAAILVVRSGCTTRELAQAAVLRMSEDRIPVLGSIMNDCNHGDELHSGKTVEI
jgi:capsular exopolysaccharide synthesis family protein